uniref:Uncharacterized protein n=1 Tax=Oryzias sinensis TaxID=183150 RepID=A0A8C7WXE6_9TELE
VMRGGKTYYNRYSGGAAAPPTSSSSSSSPSTPRPSHFFLCGAGWSYKQHRRTPSSTSTLNYSPREEEDGMVKKNAHSL